MSARGNDLTIYSRYADEWWVPGAPRFRSLQSLSPLRLDLIRRWCGAAAGKRIVDLGCGGGLLAVPLIEQGAEVIGVDSSAPSLAVANRAATAVAASARGRWMFVQADLKRVPLPSGGADIVLLADVLDHVQDYAAALREAARLLRPDGWLFASTINRNWTSWFFAILLGEGLRLIPPGTHDHSMFIRPDELIAAARGAGLEVAQRQGERLLFGRTIARWTIAMRPASSMRLTYSMAFKKASEQTESQR